jgi:branched-chain amino acid transport system substrate-binding protein
MMTANVTRRIVRSGLLVWALCFGAAAAAPYSAGPATLDTPGGEAAARRAGRAASPGVSRATQPADESPAVYGNMPERYTPFGKFTEPYKRFFLEEIPYRGPGRDYPEPTDLTSVKIGFIGPIEHTVSVATGGASHEEALGLMMLHGAHLAVEQANARGGYRGKLPYQLVVVNDNGLWGSSGNEIIKLSYSEKVWAILGTIDGANSHIAIRVALKTEVPIMNTADTDPTFSETNIPWAFRCIGDDRQMAYLIADYLFYKRKITRVAALRANNRYGRVNFNKVRASCRRAGHTFLTELNYKVGDTDFSPQLQRIAALDPQVVITWGDARESALILKQMRAMGMNQPLVGSDRMVSEEFLQLAGAQAEGTMAGYPWDPTRKDPKLEKFRGDFRRKFDAQPETYAAHAYDGTNFVLAAIEQAGLNRAKIRDVMASTKTYPGVTLARVEKGHWCFYTREQLGLPPKGE